MICGVSQMAKNRKKQSNQPKAAKQKDEKLSLGDLLQDDLVNKLKNKQKELADIEKRKAEEEEARKREERRQKEKNKSFEELLNESSLNWEKFK